MPQVNAIIRTWIYRTSSKVCLITGERGGELQDLIENYSADRSFCPAGFLHEQEAPEDCN